MPRKAAHGNSAPRLPVTSFLPESHFPGEKWHTLVSKPICHRWVTEGNVCHRHVSPFQLRFLGRNINLFSLPLTASNTFLSWSPLISPFWQSRAWKHKQCCTKPLFLYSHSNDSSKKKKKSVTLTMITSITDFINLWHSLSRVGIYTLPRSQCSMFCSYIGYQTWFWMANSGTDSQHPCKLQGLVSKFCFGHLSCTKPSGLLAVTLFSI